MRILLLEDHPIFRLGLRQTILQRWPNAAIREVATLADAVRAAAEDRFDVALCDLNLPDASGLDVVARLRRAAPGLRLLVVSLHAEAHYARRALEAGAAGYLAKDRASEELQTALECVAAGTRYITTTLAAQLADLLAGDRPDEPHAGLSAQEFRVMIRLAEGARVGDIAAEMHLSPKTVSTYRTRILDKLQLGGNADIARYCVGHRLIDGAGPDA